MRVLTCCSSTVTTGMAVMVRRPHTRSLFDAEAANDALNARPPGGRTVVAAMSSTQSIWRGDIGERARASGNHAKPHPERAREPALASLLGMRMSSPIPPQRVACDVHMYSEDTPRAVSFRQT